MARQGGEGWGRDRAQTRSDEAQGAVGTDGPDRTACTRPNPSMVGWDRFLIEVVSYGSYVYQGSEYTYASAKSNPKSASYFSSINMANVCIAILPSRITKVSVPSFTSAPSLAECQAMNATSATTSIRSMVNS